MKEFKDTEAYKNEMLRMLELESNIQQQQIVDSYHSISELKKSGFGIYPIHIHNRSYGFAEYPEISFKIPFSQATDKFKQQNSFIELFSENGEILKGSILFINEEEGKIRLYTDEFPDWLDIEKVGIRIGFDDKSIKIAKEAIETLDKNNSFVRVLLEGKQIEPNNSNFEFSTSKHLNGSQNEAVKDILSDNPVSIVHGPPGTGKTTTLVEAIRQLVSQGQKIIATAPSNMAVDHLAESLIEKGITVLRLGNPSKISENLLNHTVEGKLSAGKVFQELKKMKIQAEEFRRMASQYKRNFGKDEREQRKLIWEHFRSLKKDIRSTIDAYKEKWKDEAQVICGTPISLSDEMSNNKDFKILFIDEAGQCLQPFGWVVLKSNIEKLVLAGDPFQLPPTVISREAERGGFSTSFLDLFLTHFPSKLLNIQYRMEEKIAGFSNHYFYQGKLNTPKELISEEPSVYFFDTVGTGNEEIKDLENSSISNLGEIAYIPKIIDFFGLNTEETAVISPYSAQVSKVRELLPNLGKISTIDSFQGQEFPIVIISLVRSNEKQEIGFLKDYRRINVALTRAQHKLFVVGDSATIGNDAFFKGFLDYIDKIGAYHTAWELI